MEKITKSSDKVLIDPNEPLILPDGTALVGRVEWFLYALCCLDYQNLPTPMSRIEEFANALITGEVPNIEPQSRAEQFFLAILDGNVSDLPQPQSRSEVLLDKLARGEFDLSDVEPIQSSYELLLAYLIKNGGIDNIDYVLYEFSEAMKTMYNTVEKPFKSLELSGNTLVNCVLEDTENDDYTSFDKDYSGTSFTINGTSEGAIKSAILTGQTLVNILNGNVSINENVPYHDYKTDIEFKANAVYTAIFKVESEATSITCGLLEDGGTWNGGLVDVRSGYNKVLLTPSTTKTYGLRIRHFDGASVAINTSDVMLIEGDYTNVDIPYFEGMQSVKMPGLTTVGKNLLNPNTYTIGWAVENLIKNDDSFTLDITEGWGGIQFKDLKLKPNTNYTFKFETNKSTVIGFAKISGQENQGGKTEFTFTTDNTGLITLTIEAKSPTSSITLSNIQLEEGDIATTYEHYKSNILSTPEDLELRGVGKVKDELNVATGELTQRVGEIVLDGSENWWIMNEENIVNKRFRFDFISKKNNKDKTILCKELLSASNSEWDVDREQIEADGAYLSIRKAFDTVEDFKTWLSQNPITIQYQLKTESIKTVDLNVVDQNNNKIDKIHIFDEVTHVNALSDELTPTVNIDKSVSYPTIIKPNTKYTVDLKRNDKPLTVNLGGT